MSGERNGWWSRMLIAFGLRPSPQRALDRRGRRELARLFADRRELLKGTSLRPQHGGRTQVLEVREDPFRVYFGIVRHPRPYAFSRQYHEVLEIWCFHVDEGRLERIRGENLSRQRGDDGSPSSYGAGV